MAEQQQNLRAPEENLTEVVKVRREKLEAAGLTIDAAK